MQLEQIIQFNEYPLSDTAFQQRCKQHLDEHGALVLPDFISAEALTKICQEGAHKKHLAYYSKDDHNVYLKDPDPDFADDHPRNQPVQSSKGCITDNQIAEDSPLRTLYDAETFRDFLATVLGEQGLYNYADPMSSINLHYADEGQELGWHFDNSSFAITLLIQSPEAGGSFEYVENLRDADRGEMNYDGVAEVLAGKRQVKTLQAGPGTLAMFRGRNALHRVTPVKGDKTRMLVVLAYNSEPGIALSESARLTFYGRL
ncbi:2OG-Fe(II) oxygenase [Motiliproteus coralliicola]|uniref:2OG-Fe(II) oxygenase n=1 Tax=Motiliproteus coralliicola TaxID=2283196 RepID=A0A369WSI0_9GAMM|nr:2OG-Fe(II) oxygenase [Motiliproteus coralliicola]RDE25060.1 2OG-Fe(II) oxygenase [Motiliproteus coralliicola]